MIATDWLHEVILESGRSGLFNIGRIRIGRHGDEQGVDPSPLGLADECVAGAVGKSNVADDDVELLLAQPIDRAFQISRCGNVVIVAG